jgi:hypothetical protein
MGMQIYKNIGVIKKTNRMDEKISKLKPNTPLSLKFFMSSCKEDSSLGSNEILLPWLFNITLKH